MGWRIVCHGLRRALPGQRPAAEGGDDMFEGNVDCAGLDGLVYQRPDVEKGGVLLAGEVVAVTLVPEEGDGKEAEE